MLGQAEKNRNEASVSTHRARQFDSMVSKAERTKSVLSPLVGRLTSPLETNHLVSTSIDYSAGLFVQQDAVFYVASVA